MKTPARRPAFGPQNCVRLLAELRNAIRHSRTVDEVTRKEGEAALLWFRQVLTK